MRWEDFDIILPAKDEFDVVINALDVAEAAHRVNATFDYEEQEKWERILILSNVLHK